MNEYMRMADRMYDLDNQFERLQKENAELKEKLNRYEHDCPNCSAFGKHCPHKENGDPYTYDCYLTVEELEKENAKLKEFVNAPHTKGRKTTRGDYIKTVWDLSKQLTKAKEIIKELVRVEYADFTNGDYSNELSKVLEQAEQFLKDVGKVK